MENLKNGAQESEEPQFNLRAPPDNYAFNNLIQDFAEEIQEDDVDVIKRRFEGIITGSVQTGRELFDCLIQNGYISETNIIYLQQIVRILGKQNLLQKTINFAKDNEESVLHFHETAPGRGQTVRIHVEGHGRLKHKDLDNLRHEISRIVLVPPEDVCFAGIEETNSVIITFALPDMYTEALKELLRNTNKHYHFISLRKLGVDRIEVLGDWYEIRKNVKRFNNCEEKERNESKLLPTVESTNKYHEENVEENTAESSESKKPIWIWKPVSQVC